MQSGKRGRPIAPPAWSLEMTIAELERGLDTQPATVSVASGRAALKYLEQMRQEKRERYDLLHIRDLYAALVEDHNAIWEAARARGIEVYQTFGSEEWTWDNGQRRGNAATPAAALLAALDDKSIIA